MYSRTVRDVIQSNRSKLDKQEWYEKYAKLHIESCIEQNRFFEALILCMELTDYYFDKQDLVSTLLYLTKANDLGLWFHLYYSFHCQTKIAHVLTTQEKYNDAMELFNELYEYAVNNKVLKCCNSVLENIKYISLFCNVVEDKYSAWANRFKRMGILLVWSSTE